MSGHEMRPTRYVGAETAADWRQAQARGLPLRLTTDDVARATGTTIVDGMTIEYEITGTTAHVRVVGLDGAPGDWADIELRAASDDPVEGA